MAKKSTALTKEERRLQSQGAAKGRKSAETKAETARLVVGGSSLVAGAIAGIIDKRSLEKNEARASFKVFGIEVPTNAAIGGGGMALGYMMGKGEVAAAAFGAGLGTATCSVYGMVLDRKSDEED